MLDTKDYQVLLFSKNGTTSPIIDYLSKLQVSNPRMTSKAISSLKILPLKLQANHDIKVIQNTSVKLFELRVQSGNDICRFFFVIENPDIIVLYGFTKKTQKTQLKDINQGIKAYHEYIENKNFIIFDI